MTSADAWAAAAAAFYLGQVATVAGLLWIAIEQRALASVRAHMAFVRVGHASRVFAPDDRSWLLLVVLAAACSSLGDLLHHLGVHGLRRMLAPLTDAPLLLLGPGLWFYTRAITRHVPEPQPSWRDFSMHALPAILAFVLLAWSVLSDPSVAPPVSPGRSLDEVLSLVPVAVQLLIYLVLMLRRVRSARSRVVQEQSDLTDRKLRWLSGAAWLLGCVVVVWMLSWSWPVALSNLVTNLLMAGWLTLIGLFGVRQSNVFSSRLGLAPTVDWAMNPGDAASMAVTVSASGSAQDQARNRTSQPPAETTSPRYAKAPMAPEQVAMLATRLHQVMQRDKPFLESDLNLSGLAQAIGATPHQLSQVLSTAVGQSFYDYVNAWRVDAVRATLMRPGSAARPLLEIALECGFGSKSAFNEVFRRATGMTPGAYRKGLPATAAAAGQVRPPGDERQVE